MFKESNKFFLNRFIKPHYKAIIPGIIIVAVARFMGTAFVSRYKPIINLIAAGAERSELLRQILILGAMVLCAVLGDYIGSKILIFKSIGIAEDIRADLFAHVQSLPVAFFDQNRPGEVMSSFTNDLDLLTEALGRIVPQIIGAGVATIGNILFMLLISPPMTLILLFMMTFVFFAVVKISKRSAENFRKTQDSLGNINGFVTEYLSGQKVVKVFNHEEKSVEDMEVVNSEYAEKRADATFLSSVVFPMLKNSNSIIFAIMAIVGSVMSINGVAGMDIGSLVTMLQYTQNFNGPVAQASSSVQFLVSAMASLDRIYGYFKVEAEDDPGHVFFMKDKKNRSYWAINKEDIYKISRLSAKHFKESDNPDISKNYLIRRVRGQIEFEHVDFSYIKDKPVLKDVSFCAPAGERVAIVGRTGSGKTTVAKLITRFYEPDSGKIMIDGIDIAEMKKSALRKMIGMVTQDIYMFSGTVKYNIAYGNFEASDEAIKEAAKNADAAYFIEGLEEGYDTMVDDDGRLRLSRGQSQLISIARAGLKDPAVLILDEATSSVDTRTERRVTRGMDRMMQNRTVIAIAHRLSTVINSDQILFMHDGHICERGTHDELMALKGRYYQLNMSSSGDVDKMPDNGELSEASPA